MARVLRMQMRRPKRIAHAGVSRSFFLIRIEKRAKYSIVLINESSIKYKINRNLWYVSAAKL